MPRQNRECRHAPPLPVYPYPCLVLSRCMFFGFRDCGGNIAHARSGHPGLADRHPLCFRLWRSGGRSVEDHVLAARRIVPGCGRWQASDAAAFHASAVPGVPTTVLIHGNGTDEDWAVRHGNELYCLMKQQACGRPFRLVVWSWPADRAVRRSSSRRADQGLPQRRGGLLPGPRASRICPKARR